VISPRVLSLFVTATLVLVPPVRAEVRASLDRTRVYEGDTITLTIEIDGTAAPRPELSPLSETFDVLATGNGTQVSIVNGHRSDTTRWQITLAPRRTGEIRIPPLSVGAEKTPSLTVTVEEAAAIPHHDERVFVELRAEPSSPSAYVQQQVPLTVRLFSTLPLRQGTLSDPHADSAVVERLGEDRRYMTERNGKRYQVIERRYVLSPEQSGPLHIAPVVFKGNLPAERDRQAGTPGSPLDRLRNDPFFDRFFSDDLLAAFEPGRPVTVRSEGLDIQVKTRPENWKGPWLPAEDLELEDSWGGVPPELRAGEPVTRALTLKTRGLTGSQIPPLDLGVGDELRVYPETPQNETRTDGTTVHGTSRQSFVLIPHQAGRLQLPEVRVRWWDIRSDRERETVLPAVAVEVLEGRTGAAATPGSDAAPVGAPAPATAEKSDATAATPSIPAPPPQARSWVSAAAAILALTLAGIAVWQWRRRRSSRRRSAGPPPAPTTARPAAADAADAARRGFLAACDANDPADAARHLLRWAAAERPDDPPRNLGALARDLAEESDAVMELDRALYAGGGSRWDGAALKRALAAGVARRDRNEPPDQAGLPPLYPRRT